MLKTSSTRRCKWAAIFTSEEREAKVAIPLSSNASARANHEPPRTHAPVSSCSPWTRPHCRSRSVPRQERQPPAHRSRARRTYSSPSPTPRPVPPRQASPVPVLPHSQIPTALYGRCGLRFRRAARGQSISSPGHRRAGLLFLPRPPRRRSPPPPPDLLRPRLFLLPRPPRRQSLPPPAAAAPPIFSSSPARGLGRSWLSGLCSPANSLRTRAVFAFVGDGVECLLLPLPCTLCKGAFASPKCSLLLDSA
jgi:hypothetical protein